LCYVHDPNRAEQRKEGQRKGQVQSTHQRRKSILWMTRNYGNYCCGYATTSKQPRVCVSSFAAYLCQVLIQDIL